MPTGLFCCSQAGKPLVAGHKHLEQQGEKKMNFLRTSSGKFAGCGKGFSAMNSIPLFHLSIPTAVWWCSFLPRGRKNSGELQSSSHVYWQQSGQEIIKHLIQKTVPALLPAPGRSLSPHLQPRESTSYLSKQEAYLLAVRMQQQDFRWQVNI